MPARVGAPLACLLLRPGLNTPWVLLISKTNLFVFFCVTEPNTEAISGSIQQVLGSGEFINRLAISQRSKFLQRGQFARFASAPVLWIGFEPVRIDAIYFLDLRHQLPIGWSVGR